jgi:hypothetical protein
MLVARQDCQFLVNIKMFKQNKKMEHHWNCIVIIDGGHYDVCVLDANRIMFAAIDQ